MTKVLFYRTGSLITGFRISGHSGFAEAGEDIVCAAVSSAAYMTANTVTDVLGLKPKRLEVSDGFFALSLQSEDAKKASDILNGFHVHVKGLSKDYDGHITVTTLTIKNNYGGAENA